MTEQPKFLGAIDYMELYDLANSNDTRNMNTGAAGGVIYGEDYIANYKAKMNQDPYNYPNSVGNAPGGTAAQSAIGR